MSEVSSEAVWWLGLIGLLILLLMMPFRVLQVLRGMIRPDPVKGFVRFVRKTRPDLAVAVLPDRIRVQATANSHHDVSLESFLRNLPRHNRTQLREYYEKNLRICLDSHKERADFTREDVLKKVFPRLLTADILRHLDSVKRLCARHHESLPLHMAFVLNQEDVVSYLFEEELIRFEISYEELESHAVGNLRDLNMRNAVDRVLLHNEMVQFHLGDTLDAARLLGIPGLLHENQRLAAIIPDRDVLVLTPAPPSPDGWDALARLAAEGMSGSHPLLPRPVEITANGLTVR